MYFVWENTVITLLILFLVIYGIWFFLLRKKRH
ncbi:PEP-CTERM protein sorting domain [Paenibacillus barengoltzii G22]|uniref:PEP-CTERM protein sorting domain n=1 Tax=Paenibacillus barengoltzii G22 TaxID=1235795 RepID=R9L6W2_9BACL|nr:PEP-CTERM protein sorting domain [Paenibacillus barengoltzii G22]